MRRVGWEWVAASMDIWDRREGFEDGVVVVRAS